MKKRIFAILLVLTLLICASASAATMRHAYSGGVIYLRTGPGTQYGDNGCVSDGDYLDVLEYGSVWSRVRTGDGRTGYIKNLYISGIGGEYASGTSYTSRYKAYTTASVNLRAGASTSTAVITTLASGTRVTVLGTNGGFYLVETAQGTQGYVSMSYVSKGGNPSPTPSYETKTVSASAVHMREGGGTSYPIITTIYRGAKVQVLARGNYWMKCSYNGYEGWIKSNYLY